MANIFKPFSLLLTAFLLVSGCCAGIQCDCIPSGITISYQASDSSPCPSNFATNLTVKAFNLADQTFAFDAEGASDFNCKLFIPYSPNYFWLIQSDNLGISDTLRIFNPIFSKKSKGCCDCGQRIIGGDIRINGTVYSSQELIRNY